jgi:hypothetical protein
MEDIDQKLTDLVTQFKENMTELAMGKRGFSAWVPTTNNKHKEFLTDLGIPSDTRMKPDLLLFELGRLSREDPVFSKRVNNLFGPGILSHRYCEHFYSNFSLNQYAGFW